MIPEGDDNRVQPAKSQADTCGSSRQHDTAGSEQQTPTHTCTEAGCVRQQSQAVIGCDRRAVIRCTRINKNWSDPAQQTETHTHMHVHTHKHTLIHTHPSEMGLPLLDPRVKPEDQKAVSVCVCLYVSVCLCQCMFLCYVTFIGNKRILPTFKNI